MLSTFAPFCNVLCAHTAVIINEPHFWVAFILKLSDVFRGGDQDVC